MHMKRERIRNATKARHSFVTRKAEAKISALANFFREAAGEHWVRTEGGTLQRKLVFSGFHCLDYLQLVYNWENRFTAVNYNLQLVSAIPTTPSRFEETHDCLLTLKCTQRGLKGEREYSWDVKQWGADDAMLQKYLERLANPLITQRLDVLDIFEMELRHNDDQDYWRISCESMIGSATWILIPPVMSMITPKPHECMRFLELFELIGDALVNNKE